MPDETEPADAVRAFNRFYTREIGVLQQHLLDSPFSLAEARVLYELADRNQPTATELVAALGLDAGYLSRLLQGLTSTGLVARKPSPEDRRQHRLALTARGRAAFERLDRASQAAAVQWLARMTAPDRGRVVTAMRTIERLATGAAGQADITLRAPGPGDMGWVVQSHGAIYARDYGFDSSFEALVAEIVAKFIGNFDASRERCWIAESDGRQVGSVFLTKHSDDVAKLRLLIVSDDGRSRGLGRKLVEETLTFARQCGYRRITLWTQSILIAARSIYQDTGFRLAGSEAHRSFGQNLIGETWERDL